jgi:hypothetical protein
MSKKAKELLSHLHDHESKYMDKYLEDGLNAMKKKETLPTDYIANFVHFHEFKNILEKISKEAEMRNGSAKV